MVFGREETFQLIERGLLGDDEAYESLCDILYEDAGMLVNKYCQGIQSSDKEDILQNVICNAIRGLPRFYMNSEHNSEQERNAWLKTIVINEKNTFFRKIAFSVNMDALEYDDSILQEEAPDVEKTAVLKEDFLQALGAAFQIQTTPEKLIAFVYNRLLDGISGGNGSPQAIAEDFDGMTVAKAYERMVQDLSATLQYRISEGVLEPLKQKVDAEPGRAFSLSARTITDSSNWIVKKMKERYRYE